MLGGIAIVIALLLIPVGVLMTGAAASAIIGEVFARDSVRRHEGSELLDVAD
jgi:dipeptide/tripeptide permease